MCWEARYERRYSTQHQRCLWRVEEFVSLTTRSTQPKHEAQTGPSESQDESVLVSPSLLTKTRHILCSTQVRKKWKSKREEGWRAYVWGGGGGRMRILFACGSTGRRRAGPHSRSLSRRSSSRGIRQDTLRLHDPPACCEMFRLVWSIMQKCVHFISCLDHYPIILVANQPER